MEGKNLYEVDGTRGGSDCTHKKQGSVQVSEILRGHVMVMFIGNFLVGGPEVCGWVCLGARGFPIFDRQLQPEAG